jgi:hypothetical protein
MKITSSIMTRRIEKLFTGAFLEGWWAVNNFDAARLNSPNIA